MYVDSFTLPSQSWEDHYQNPKANVEMRRTCYTSYYPFGIFPEKQLTELHFAPVTFLYGGNGSGKTTLLNLIAERLRIRRGTYFNRSNFLPTMWRNAAMKRLNFWRPLPTPAG